MIGFSFEIDAQISQIPQIKNRVAAGVPTVPPDYQSTSSVKSVDTYSLQS
jgi:hypothetical protein